MYGKTTPGTSLELPGCGARAQGRTCTGESHGIRGILPGTISPFTRGQAKTAVTPGLQSRPLPSYASLGYYHVIPSSTGGP